ncbi:hypothetical protein [Picosynechococcus sp. NKBG042902]|uniref:hypothetical protein n=1 Tax=Picosynechococcus sp. NKBG042902 TaxID=490193 RepID=UPI0004AB4024|nr:hypothetical protein [Picosynechococcus sp. NKBG042902]
MTLSKLPQQDTSKSQQPQVANNVVSTRPADSVWSKAGKICVWIGDQAIWCNPNSLHGTARVTKELKKNAENTAAIVTASTLVNTIGIAPFIQIALGGLGGLSLPATVLFLGLLNAGSNKLGTIAAKNGHGKQAWSWGGSLGFLALNLSLTAFTGPGFVMFTNKPEVQQTKAAQIIDAQRDRLEVLKPDADKFAELEAEIAEGKAVQQRIVEQYGDDKSREIDEWQRWEVRLYGDYEDRNQDWTNVEIENLPFVRKLERLETEASQAYDEASAKLDESLVQRAEFGNDVQFLEAEMPEHFTSAFEANYELKSPADGAAIATELFLSDLLNLQISRLAFPMLMMVISIVFSLVACYLTYTFSKTAEVQASFDPKKQAQLQRAIHTLRRRLD